MVKLLGICHLRISSDSQLVVRQLRGEYPAKHQTMEAYLSLARSLLQTFATVEIQRIPRTSNSHADALATLASSINSQGKREVEVTFLHTPSILSTCDVFCAGLGTSWMDPIVAYLRDESLPADNKKAHKVKAQSSRYWLSPYQKLYRMSFSGPYIRCLHPAKVQDFLFEIHESSCGSHTGGRSLTHRARSQGF